ncbi:MAG: M13 family metallopeptidase [Chitinophagales bacterium]|nr:M13 family metallopeptidase [Chitinophagales bacterium]MCZ2392774.1 M13 family metallopeptidase [Chitinophagales bacterium]
MKTSIGLFCLSMMLSAPLRAQPSSTACHDFDHYINADWKAQNPVPSTESRWGSFNILAKDNDKKMEGIVNDLLKTSFPKNSYQQQIKDLYNSLSNSEIRNKRGITPLKNYFKLIDNAASFNDLIVLNAIIPGLTLPIEGGVEADMMNSKYNTFYISQSGLSLGDKDFYLSNDEDKQKIREAFKKYLLKIELLLGKKASKAEKIASQIFAIENDIAQYHLSKEEMRNPMKIYNKYSYADMKKASPTINWDNYFKALNIQPHEIIVINPEILGKYSKIIKNHSLESWKEYLKYHLTMSMASYLPETFEQANFDFFSTTINGVKEQLPLNEKTIRRMNQIFGEPLGRLFVSKYFSSESKAKIEHMIENMRLVYADRINNLEWMSDETKKAALKKLSTFTYKIGYPKKWTDFSSIDIQEDKAFENVIKIQSFMIKKNLKEYGKETDKDKFEMNAHEVNAYYNPLFNEIVFPAGILQAPFYDANIDDAVNYGGIGAVIGHEFSHGFDDQGSQFDAEGNLNNWWTEEDRAKFDKLTQKLVKEYDNFEILPDVKVNGAFTLGENIADQGGVILGYYALLKEYSNKPEPPLVNGMDYKQRFFYGWAKIWRSNATTEALKQLIAVDPHSPAKARINVTLSNLKEFYDAFKCAPTVSEEDRVIIW